jgi:hypothetical protein
MCEDKAIKIRKKYSYWSLESSGISRRVINLKLIDVSEAERTSETSVNFNLTTRRYIPEYSKLYTRRRENLKSQKYSYLFFLTLAESEVICLTRAHE